MNAPDLAVDLVVTIRHDGSGGVADDLAKPAGLTAWVRDHAARLAVECDMTGFEADTAVLGEVVALRAAIRSLFAEAVRPGPPSRADAAASLPDTAIAVDRLNRAAARAPISRQLRRGDPDPATVTHWSPNTDPGDRLLSAAAESAITLLTGPARDRLRACQAPRCVRYFLQDHAKQEWCKPSCGNRARAARHYRRHHSGRTSDLACAATPSAVQGFRPVWSATPLPVSSGQYPSTAPLRWCPARPRASRVPNRQR